MILLYHKVDLKSRTQFWVDIDNFYRQMSELQDRQVVLLDEYDPTNPEHVVITFDDVYENVYTYAAPILKHFGYRYELFIIGDKIGKDNSFDSVEPLTSFATQAQLLSMVKDGARLQWHTNTHPNFKNVQGVETTLAELIVPEAIKKLDKYGFNWLAYPYGEFTPTTYEQTKRFFKGAVSCVQGNDRDVYSFNRLTVVNDTSFKRGTVSVVIPSHNYGRYLVEAIESVLTQTRSVDEIIIADDGSTDDTATIGRQYMQQYPDKISFIRNEKNKGIVATFNRAVRSAKGDYVCILDADNRFRSDFLEKTAAALNKNPSAAIAYTDFALFGQRAEAKYSLFPPAWKAGEKLGRFFIISFPEFNQKTKKFLQRRNFMHGNSLYRKKAFLKVGGYKLEADKPEDHSLFLRMIEKGWEAVRVPLPLLEYRQHAKDQENDRFNYFAQLHFYRANYEQLVNQKKHLEDRLALLESLNSFPFLRAYNAFRSRAAKLKRIIGGMMKRLKNGLKKARVKAEDLWKRFSLAGLDYSKLHLGSGSKNIPGWLNVDIDASFGPHVYPLDLRNDMPFPTNSVDKIFFEHLIENLSKPECIHFFDECYRVLKPGGAMRLAISDFSILISAYVNKNEKYRALMQTDMQPLLTNTWDEFLMDMSFNWHRRSYFTEELIKEFLKRAGFKKVKKKGFGKTDYGFTFDSRQLPDTKYFEAQKPLD